ncbi:pseudouridine synthase [Comamonas sp. NLF-1-9]|uniref:pseudouridine synthase n=1 Tax=Comamonas sp. NLF-1-9 TaxID=2853163 RepID=UPI001C470D2B|nr:16S rRNA pseudouridine(516) synthase [Comamonas sp. NLF-1-9]QXL84362.1 pseudouridine synthase [Comamonas sp. NLF-1-9]
MQLADALYSQGFGTRRFCQALIERGLVAVRSRSGAPCIVREPNQDVDEDGLILRVDDQDWPFQRKAYLMLHKPAGTECSQRPRSHPSIYSLLPAPLRQRPVRGGTPGVQAAGRLDQDTTGLLLLSDDGQFLHRMSSPRHRVPKRYRVWTRHAIDASQMQRLLSGVVLDDDPKPVAATGCEAVADRVLDLTLTQGKYHQVKRMLAAVGNRVERLHRMQIGALGLPGDLAPGQWRWLDADQLGLAMSPALP